MYVSSCQGLETKGQLSSASCIPSLSTSLVTVKKRFLVYMLAKEEGNQLHPYE